jgi:hypothetical protein
MIDFQPFDILKKPLFDTFLHDIGEKGCQYSFANLYMWGRQSAAILDDHLAFFSQFNRKSVYLFPVGKGDKKPVLDAMKAACWWSSRTCPLKIFAGSPNNQKENAINLLWAEEATPTSTSILKKFLKYAAKISLFPISPLPDMA